MSKITIDNMQFHAYHGCLEQEQISGNTFLVTLSIELDTKLAEKTDELNDTLDYQEIYDVVKEEMEIPSQLIEHVGRRIYDAISNKFPQITNMDVKLSKLNPPLGGRVASVSVENFK